MPEYRVMQTDGYTIYVGSFRYADLGRAQSFCDTVNKPGKRYRSRPVTLRQAEQIVAALNTIERIIKQTEEEGDGAPANTGDGTGLPVAAPVK